MKPLNIVEDRSLEERLKELVADELGIDVREITPESRFVENFNADSLDMVELVMRVQEDFETDISDEEAEGIKTVSDAFRIIQCKVGGG